CWGSSGTNAAGSCCRREHRPTHETPHYRFPSGRGTALGGGAGMRPRPACPPPAALVRPALDHHAGRAGRHAGPDTGLPAVRCRAAVVQDKVTRALAMVLKQLLGIELPL